MDPMTHLLLASFAFLATHYVSSTQLRDVLVQVLGQAYLAMYTLIAFVTLGWMIWAFYHAPFINLWYAVALRAVPLAVMPVAMLFFVCGLTTPNPTLVGKSHILDTDVPARGILRITRHPLMWSFALWAVSHIAARGDAASLVFFGTFAVLALTGTWLIDRRKAAALGENWKKFAAVTSNLPLAAIVGGRNHFRLAEIGVWRILLSIIGYGALIVFHHALFGAHATI
jgi:uncharacterized membrane protein